MMFGSLRVQSVLLLNVKLAFSARKTKWQHKGSPVFPKVERNEDFIFSHLFFFLLINSHFCPILSSAITLSFLKFAYLNGM